MFRFVVNSNDRVTETQTNHNYTINCHTEINGINTTAGFVPVPLAACVKVGTEPQRSQ